MALGAGKEATPLPETRTYAEAVVGIGLVAVVGGSTSSGCATSTLIAKIQPSGLGDWAPLGQFGIPRIRHAVALENDRLSVIGGTDTTGAATVDVQFAPISTTTVGPWSNTQALTWPRTDR